MSQPTSSNVPRNGDAAGNNMSSSSVVTTTTATSPAAANPTTGMMRRKVSSDNGSSVGNQNSVVTLEACLFGDSPHHAFYNNNHHQHMKKSSTLDTDSKLVLLEENGADVDIMLVNEENKNDRDDDDDHDHGDDSSNNSASSILEELAPVSSKWSDCASDDALDDNGCYGPPHTIHLPLLRKIVSAGGVVDDDDERGASHRAVAWRVLLGYLPAETERWHEVLLEQRNLYTQLVSDLFADTADVVETAEELRGRPCGRQHRHYDGTATTTTPPPNTSNQHGGSRESTEIPVHVKQHWKLKSLDLNVLERLTKDLNALQMKDLVEPVVKNEGADEVASDDDATKDDNRDENNLNDFVESALLLDEIRKDVIRTNADLSFFLEPFHNLGRRRYAALERILFVWSKYNKGVRYVQGMNEIVGILYYVLANDQNEEWAVWAEADTYWLFHVLLAEMSDVFVAGLDDHDTGIQGRINAMQALLARHDPEVKEHLDEVGIEVSFYAIRWWTTLLSREFLLPDTIRLWDSMFASTHKDNFLRYVCVIMVMTMRDRLLMGDFSTCLKLLHAFPSTSIERLLESSRALWIYESQISVACHRGGLSLHQSLTTIESPPALIMAFGFPNGTPPVSRVEQLERATVNIEATVRSAAQEMFGRARGFYNRYSKDYTKKERSNSADRSLALGRAKEEDVVKIDEEDVYLKAFLHT